MPVRTKPRRRKVVSMESLWKVYRNTMLARASESEVLLAHDAFFGAILAYCKALNHVLEKGEVQRVTESIRRLAGTTALAQKLARGPTH
ncbi:MAG TPA: hypothetical protein VMU40_18975 [Steroidobacteraceae bacterium]|nr:hypothetical protein [Steroidobacteraceae bacterium]